MNRQTFKDVVADKRSAFINDVEDDEDDDAELGKVRMKVNQAIEGEEDYAQESVRETLIINRLHQSIEPLYMYMSISSLILIS